MFWKIALKKLRNIKNGSEDDKKKPKQNERIRLTKTSLAYS